MWCDAWVSGVTKIVELDYREPAVRGGQVALHRSPPGQRKRTRNLKGCFGFLVRDRERQVFNIVPGGNGHRTAFEYFKFTAP